MDHVQTGLMPSSHKFRLQICLYNILRLLGRAVAAGEADCGILICGTGVGISLAANKIRGIRCAVCSDVTTAHLTKEHNNANIIAFGARIVGNEQAKGPHKCRALSWLNMLKFNNLVNIIIHFNGNTVSKISC